MFSLGGYYTYYIDFYIASSIDALGYFSYGLPPDVLWGIKNGTSFENIWYLLLLPRVYFKHLWLPIIGLEVEKGFKLGWIILFISWKNNKLYAITTY